MFDINGDEFLVLLVVAVIVVGPERLPRYAREFRLLVARAREALSDARRTVRDEMGDTVDFAAIDPRRYDPRRLAREVLSEPEPSRASARPDGRAARRRSEGIRPGQAPPYDDDAT